MTNRVGRALGVLLLSLHLSACGISAPLGLQPLPTLPPARTTEPPEESIRPAPEEIYGKILEDCYAVLYADWYRPLTAEDLIAMDLSPLLLTLGGDRDSFGRFLRDLNGDGTEELFLGLGDADGGTIYGVYTFRGGQALSLYTVTEGDALFLCRDNTLLQEGMSFDGSIYLKRYSVNAAGMVDALGGLQYDRSAEGGPYFSVDVDGSMTPIDESAFLDAVRDFEARKEQCRFVPLRTLPQSAAPSVADSVPPPAQSPEIGD